MKAEKKALQILNSFDGMQRAQPSPYLFSKINARVQEANLELIPFRWISISLASLGLLLLIDFAVTRYSSFAFLTQKEQIIQEQQGINTDQIY
jgi:hypothetical protein